MSLTTPAAHVPDARIGFTAWLRHHLGWVFVALVVLATAVLGVLVVLDDGPTAAVTVSERPAASYTGDWKDTVAGADSAVSERRAASYTGDWKDTVAGADSAVPAPAARDRGIQGPG